MQTPMGPWFGFGDVGELPGMMKFTEMMKADAEHQQPLVCIVAKLLAKLVDTNDKMPADKEITVFHAQKAPAVSVVDYADRISKYSSCSPCCFVVGMIYVDRFIQQQRAKHIEFKVNSLNVHRLMLSSIMVAAKFLDDFYYSNEFWAKIGGVSNAELNTLELEFLFLTNFELQVHRDLYEKYRSGLMQWNGDQNNNAMGIGTGLGFQLGSKRLAHLVGGALTYNNGSAQPDTPCDDNVDIDGGEEMMADDSRGSSSWENSNGANTPPPYHSQDGIEGQGKGVDSEDMVMD